MTDDAAGPAATELDNGTVELTLPSEPSSAGAARRYVHQRWTDLDDDMLADVELIVTELVSNAVRYGLPEIVVRLRVKPFALDVAVLDHGPGWPRLQSQEESASKTSGRGLAIIDRLSAAWGVRTLDDRPVGKEVWASIDRV